MAPNVWATSGPPPGSNPAPNAVKPLLQDEMDAMKKANVVYAQMNGTTFKFPSATAPGGNDQWIWELGYQHNYAYCKTYIGDDVICKQ